MKSGKIVNSDHETTEIRYLNQFTLNKHLNTKEQNIMTNTQTKTAHSPTPWHVGIKQAEQIIYDEKGNAVANATTFYFDSTKELCHANAQFIVKAVNCHEEAMDIISLAHGYIKDAGDVELLARIDSLISNMGVKS